MDQNTTEKENVMGRPTIYTPELRKELCRRLASGRTLRSVCRDEDMPCREKVEDWLIDCDNEEKKDKPWVSDDFVRHYARARDIQAENVHDEIVEIADDATNDFMEIVKKQKDGSEKKTIILDKEAVMRSKLRVDARLSWLANTSPRKYGKSLKVQQQDVDKAGNPIDPVERNKKADDLINEALAKLRLTDGK